MTTMTPGVEQWMLMAANAIYDTANYRNRSGDEVTRFAELIASEYAKRESGSAGTADGWVSVEERLPNIGQTVLAWKPSSESCDLVVYSQNSDGHRRIIRRDGQWWNSGKQITHWRPLPPAPEKAR